jgi:hypothetical protein
MNAPLALERREGLKLWTYGSATLSAFLTLVILFSSTDKGPLKISVKGPQGPLSASQSFDLETSITSMSDQTQILHLSQCSYSSLQWSSDSSLIQVDDLPCKKNRVFDIVLKPGASYAGSLPLHAAAPRVSLPHSIQFRVGFHPRMEASPRSGRTLDSAASAIIWSEPIMVTIGK